MLDADARASLRKQLEDASRKARRESATGALAYLHHVVIDKAGEPTLFRKAAEDWQWLLASRIIPAMDAVAGVRKEYRGPRSFWFTLPRGHDKTSLVGRLCSWALAFGRLPLRCIAAAADREQAGFIAEFMQAEARLNPWLGEMLRFSNWRVDGPNGSRLKILSADDKSSFGLKEDIMVLDEISHWPKQNLWNTIFSGREKRPGSVLVVITNAGLYGTWQRDVFEFARSSPDWYVYEAPGQLASWMDKGKIADVRRALPAPLARRLIDNVWIDPADESGFITREEANACIDHGMSKRLTGLPGVQYVASIDYAPVRDATALCVGHEKDGIVYLDRMDVLQGSPTSRVPIQAVEAWIEEVRHGFFRPTLVLDPYQTESIAQKYEGTLEVVRFEARGGKANYELAANLRNLVVNERLFWYPGAGQVVRDGRVEDLTDELCQVLLKVTSYGFRIDHLSTKHDDRTIAMGQMAWQLIQQSGRTVLQTGGRWF